MSPSRRITGARAERIAEDFLRKKGYEILDRNYRSQAGEIDIIARYHDCLIFVEVRSKKDSAFGMPEESISSVKKERLISLADAYIQSCNIEPNSWRIDVIAMEFAHNNRITRINHIINAIS